MKIGLARRGYSPTGGAEAYLRRFAAALAPAGHHAVLFATDQWPGWSGQQGESVILPGSSPRAFADALARERGACDFLFSLERVWSCDAYRAGDGVHRAWLERRRQVEPRWKSWGRTFNRKHRELLELEAALYSPTGAGRIIANSGMVRREIIAHYGYPAERISVVYNGLPLAEAPEPQKVRQETRQRLGLKEGEIAILFAGSGWERKGARYAVEAMRELGGLPGGTRARLFMAGRGNARALERLAPSGRVTFLGPIASREAMQALYEAADLFLLPTLYDPFSNACLEALAAGLPVVTTTANGFSEIVELGVEGEAVEDPADVATLARVLASWLDPERCGSLRERLRALGRRYSIDRNVRETLDALALFA